MKRSIAWCIAVLAIAPAAAHGHGGHGGRHFYDKADAERATSFGQPGDPKLVSQSITVEMSDSACFRPAQIRLRQGDTARFVVTNTGTRMHELVLGTSHELSVHAAEARKTPAPDHDESFVLHVEPGATQAIIWRFTQVGLFGYDCLIHGVNEGKMDGRITVTR